MKLPSRLSKERRMMDKKTLEKILADHRLWLRGEGGTRADLRHADLRHADLHGADLRYADLRHADLGGADLRGVDLDSAELRGVDLDSANLDFSVLPLRCGGLHWKIDKRIAAQIAYHFCSMECGDPGFIRARNSILDFANQFHRVDECGRLLPAGENGTGTAEGGDEL
jgi:hypothetical protein